MHDTFLRGIAGKSGYSVYNPMIKEREIKSEMSLDGVQYPPLPAKKYSIIYADPPWHYNGKVQFDKSIVRKDNPNYEKEIFLSSASFMYPTIKTDDLKIIPIVDISENDCLLFLWTTNPHLAQAIELGAAWGFEYKTVAFVWHKQNHNPGQYTLSYCELCLLFKRGRIPSPRGARNIKQFVSEPRQQHSKKPDEVRNNIIKMFPTQTKIELFARKKCKNWDSWGLEICNDS